MKTTCQQQFISEDRGTLLLWYFRGLRGKVGDTVFEFRLQRASASYLLRAVLVSIENFRRG